MTALVNFGSENAKNFVCSKTTVHKKSAHESAFFVKPFCTDYFSDKIHLTNVFASAAETCGFAGIGI